MKRAAPFLLLAILVLASPASPVSPEEAWRERLDQGMAAFDSHLFAPARQYFLDALKIMEGAGTDRPAALVQLYLGRCEMALAEYDRARERFLKAEAAFARLGEGVKQAEAFIHLADLDTLRGDSEAAVSHLQSAVGALSRDPAGRSRLPQAYMRMAKNLRRLGRQDEAAAALRQAADTARSQKQLKHLSDALLVRGDLDMARGDLAEAEAAYKEALAVNGSLDRDDLEAACARGLARVKLARDKPGEAEPLLHLALRLDESLGLIRSQVDDLHLLGVVAYDQDRHKEAADHLERALELIDGLRRLARGELRRGYLAAQLGISARLVDVHSALGDPAGVFRAFENGRARFLAETLARPDLENRVLDLDDFRKSLPEDTLVLLQTLTGKNRLRTLAVAREGVRLKRNSFKEYDSKVPDRPKSYLDAVIAFRAVVSDPAAEREALAEAGRRVAEPLLAPAAELMQGKSRLVLIQDSALALIPFDALPGPSGRLLAEDFLVTAAPSATLLNLVRERPQAEGRNLFLGLAVPEYHGLAPTGDPGLCGQEALVERLDASEARAGSMAFAYACLGLNGFPDLPGSVDEVRRACVPFPRSRALIGAEATEAALKGLAADGELAGARVIHFATRGLVVPGAPQLTALALSGGGKGREGDDGFLRLPEIAALPLDADVAAVTGLEPVRGKPVQEEGLVGLTGAFLAAGAAGFVADLWPVPDGASATLFSAFYAGINQGADPAAALAAAKRRMLSGALGPRFAAPAYWASFQYYGR